MGKCRGEILRDGGVGVAQARLLRDVTSEQSEVARLKDAVQAAERAAILARQQADAVSTGHDTARAIFERAGAAIAMLEARREQLHEHEQKAVQKESQARDLRRQIDELRSQLARYAEALEEDLSSGRERVATRTREGVGYEKSFGELMQTLITHLKAKPEVRDLLAEVIQSASLQAPAQRGVESHG